MNRIAYNLYFSLLVLLAKVASLRSSAILAWKKIVKTLQSEFLEKKNKFVQFE